MPHLWIPATSIALALACAACGGDSSPLSSPSPGVPTASSVSPSADATSPQADPDGLSVQQRAAFQASVSALHRFSRANDEFVKQRVLTSNQASYFRRYAVDWTQNWAALARSKEGNIVVRGQVRELSVRPISVRLNTSRGQVVVLRRCLDQRGLRVFADGRRVPQPQLRKPRVYRVLMLKRPTETWWRTGVPTQGATCSGA